MNCRRKSVKAPFGFNGTVGLLRLFCLIVVLVDLISHGRAEAVHLSLQPLYLISLGLNKSQEVLKSQAWLLHADIEVRAVITLLCNCVSVTPGLGPVTVSLGQNNSSNFSTTGH